MNKKIVVLISGSGSNLQALIDANERAQSKIDEKTSDIETITKSVEKIDLTEKTNIESKETNPLPLLHGEIVRVISSSDSAYGLERAAKANIPTTVHALKTYYKGIPKDNKEERKIARNKFDSDLADLVIKEKPDLVVCAGWMLILSLSFLNPISKADIPVINLHPALPGAFEGTHAIERSFEAGQKGEIEYGGCMVHYVIEEVDMGEPLVVKKLKVTKGETVEEWEKKIHDLEHVAIVEGAEKVLHRG